MSKNTLSFDEFCDLLIPYGALNSPAELHGLLCGRLCGGQALERDHWLSVASEFLDVTTALDGQLQDEISVLYEATCEQLNSGMYDMQLLLPDNDMDIDQRAQALSQWCHGFLSGFGSAGISPNASIAPDSADALRDIAAIVQVTTDEEDDEQSQERNYNELVEYVRMVAMNFYDEHQADREHNASPTREYH